MKQYKYIVRVDFENSPNSGGWQFRYRKDGINKSKTFRDEDYEDALCEAVAYRDRYLMDMQMYVNKKIGEVYYAGYVDHEGTFRRCDGPLAQVGQAAVAVDRLNAYNTNVYHITFNYNMVLEEGEEIRTQGRLIVKHINRELAWIKVLERYPKAFKTSAEWREMKAGIIDGI